MKLLYCCILFLTLALPGYGQRPGSGLVISRLEDFIEVTKHVAETSATAKSHAEVRPEVNRLLVIAAFGFVQITRNAPSREAYLESMDQTLAQLAPLMVLPEDRVQVAEFYDELLEMVGVASSDGRLDDFARRPPQAPVPAASPVQAQGNTPERSGPEAAPAGQRASRKHAPAPTPAPGMTPTAGRP